MYDFGRIISDENFWWELSKEKLSPAEYSLRIFEQAVKEGKITININIDGEISKIMHDLCFQSLIKIRHILIDKRDNEFECIESIESVLDENIGGVEYYEY